MEKALIYEFIGTAIMILMGGGVVANSNLELAKSKGAGWINIAFGWGFGVFLGVIVAGPHSGAHLNPAVTLAFATTGMFPWTSVAGYVLAQISGAFLGAVLVYFFFKNHFDATDDKELKLAIFSTMPAIKHRFHNLLAEVIGTFVLIFVILNIAGPNHRNRFEHRGQNRSGFHRSTSRCLFGGRYRHVIRRCNWLCHQPRP